MSDSEKKVAPKFSADPAAASAARRIMARCDVLGIISDEEPPRLTRTFLSPATKQAQEVVAGWMREAGLAVRVDAAGNLIGRREAAGQAQAKTFVIGSHLDTVPNAGKYDGILGVMAGIEIAESVRDAALPFALEVVGFSEEEGVRFGRPYIGSHAYAGTLEPSWLKLTDKDDVTVAEAIRSFGIEPGPLTGLTPRTDLLGYLELHIEQGPLLESSGDPIAVVLSIAGQTRMTIELSGEPGHAGTVPMRMRRDALAAAAELILAVESTAMKPTAGADRSLLATVGRIVASPNTSNVITGNVQISLDVRCSDDEVRAHVVNQLLELGEAATKRRQIDMKVIGAADFPAVHMDEWLSSILTAAAEPFCGLNSMMVSGAGHDAVVMSKVGPAAMLFVRSPGGISHSPQERVLENDVAAAITATLNFFHELIKQEPA